MAKREDMEIPEDVVDVSDAVCIQTAHRMRQELAGRTEFEFEIGILGCSESVLDKMEKTRKLMTERNRSLHGSFTKFCEESFARHCLCDWGDVSQEEKDANDQALKAGGQLFSTYTHAVHPTICILTQADRSETVIGLPEEFTIEQN